MSTDALAPVLALLIILILVARMRWKQGPRAPGAAGSSRAVPELRVHLTAEHDRTRELAAAALQLRNFSARTRQGADQPGAVDVESVREDQQCQQRREQLAALDPSGLGAMQTGGPCERVLRDAGCLARGADVGPELATRSGGARAAKQSYPASASPRR